MLIAGDIGGTKTNIALFERGDTQFLNPLHFATFPSQQYNSLESIVKAYSAKLDKNIKISGGCFAIAGPVVNGVCKATNLPWIVDAKQLASTLHVEKVYLINDLLANAYAIDIMPKSALFELQKQKKPAEGNRAIVSPGTGLGQAALYWDGTHYHPFACEGGHADFAPTNTLQIELFHYLNAQFKHVSYERILSGPGFLNLFEFFIHVKEREVPEWLEKELEGENHAVVVTKNALNGKSPLCQETLDLFVEILGQECGNAALKFMALGGLYIGGGIAPKICQVFKQPFFLEGFLNKGRFDSLLENIPIYVILDDKASLKGAASLAEKLLSIKIKI